MVNKIANRSLNKQLDEVIVHEQVENGVPINKNLNADHID
jgi:hypothetical protein